MTRGPLDTAPPASAGGDTPPRRAREAPAGSSATLGAVLAGQYAVEREIGRGGMATVWLAVERKHGRKVAIKVLHPDLAASLGRGPSAAGRV